MPNEPTSRAAPAPSTDPTLPGGRPARGRPRSADSEQAILQAALDLLDEGTDLGAISINAIAARAGVGKNTVYRRWSNKDALLVDAVASLNPPLPRPDRESVRENLILLLSVLVTRLQNTRATSILNGMIAAGRQYPQLRERYYADVVEPRREVTREVIRAGIASGELRSDLDPIAVAELLTAPLILRSVEGARLLGKPDEIAAEVVDVVLFGVARKRPGD
ncbi:TetR/AcrR family transcriptional regulator [Streptacidiphilus neutrinimicus]|uniref:TetR/AcrR family transcriptional regulator n=1 Tax=Streptacidiphilus neutrinimicus TaxID=105420 RepID=UPI0013776E1F|nr:TetR/AcrR family transcriptional regulator [Streptacidiphilus neutrinimicus]